MHKGIYWDNFEEDVTVIYNITQACLEDWNVRFSSRDSVLLYCTSDSPRIACRVSSAVLEKYAPVEPDAYKRVAALLVTMSLAPFILASHEVDGGPGDALVETLHGPALRGFGIRFLVDSLGAYFSPFEQQKSSTEWVRMDAFPGFSPETRDELVRLLFSYSETCTIALTGGYDVSGLWQGILGVSLFLKYVYPI